MSRRRRLSGIKHGWPGAGRAAVSILLVGTRLSSAPSASEQHREEGMQVNVNCVDRHRAPTRAPHESPITMRADGAAIRVSSLLTSSPDHRVAIVRRLAGARHN
jgi:hypothetical protein